MGVVGVEIVAGNLLSLVSYYLDSSSNVNVRTVNNTTYAITPSYIRATVLYKKND